VEKGHRQKTINQDGVPLCVGKQKAERGLKKTEGRRYDEAISWG